VIVPADPTDPRCRRKFACREFGREFVCYCARHLLHPSPAGQNSRVTAFLATLDTVIAIARIALLASAVVTAVVCVIDWAVRTRRISPFSGVARFFRGSIDPLMAPIERRLVGGGGGPSNAPWFALAAVVIGGIIIIWLLGFVRAQVEAAALATGLGGRGILRLVVEWIFGILQIALFVRVIASWVRASPYRWWVRWSYVLTEPLLRPLRRLIPPVGGMLDLTPLVAYFILTLLSGLVVNALPL
jgi:YggT family protein